MRDIVRNTVSTHSLNSPQHTVSPPVIKVFASAPQVSNPSVETFCQLGEKDVTDVCARSQQKKNLSSNVLESERKAVAELMNNGKSIVIHGDKVGPL